MELFDKRFVHFMWDDELKGKKCFVADNINSLIERVEKGASIYKVRWSRDNGMPFEGDDLVRYRFAYYDPNYEAKRAFNEGKEIQFKDDVSGDWCSAYNPRWDLNIEYRVKPECPCADGIDSKACVGCEHSEDGKPCRNGGKGMTDEEIENCEQTERQKHDEKIRELCSNCNKPMWRYTYINGSYLYCSFCHLRKDFERKNNLGRTSLGV